MLIPNHSTHSKVLELMGGQYALEYYHILYSVKEGSKRQKFLFPLIPIIVLAFWYQHKQ
jgi:hypothetical protein